MGRQHPGRARLFLQFLDQFLGRGAMMVAARIAFIRNDGVAHEGLDLCGKGGGALRPDPAHNAAPCGRTGVDLLLSIPFLSR